MWSAIMGSWVDRVWQSRLRRAENGRWVVSEVVPPTHTGLVAPLSVERRSNRKQSNKQSGGGTVVRGQTQSLRLVNTKQTNKAAVLWNTRGFVLIPRLHQRYYSVLFRWIFFSPLFGLILRGQIWSDLWIITQTTTHTSIFQLLTTPRRIGSAVSSWVICH